MDWRRAFQAELLSAWERAGLPPPGDHEERYAALLDAQAAPGPPPLPAGPGPLDRALVARVYAFGAVMGRACAALLGAEGPRLRERVDWCGRFNLGISLLDHLCDEAGLADRVAALPALARLGGGGAVRAPSSPAEAGLDALAAGVLDEVARELGPASLARNRGGLWGAMRRMLRAELVLARTPVAADADLAVIAGALRTASAVPFRVMAEWVAREGPGGAAARADARRLGDALGGAFWIVDDAADLWRDADARSWNVFLLDAARRRPEILSAPPSAIVDVAIAAALRDGGAARRRSRAAVRRLAAAVAASPAPEPRRRDAAGVVGAALARWLR
jgi:hypothetical protein